MISSVEQFAACHNSECGRFIQSFRIHLDVKIRLCEEADLPKLEWDGLYTAHREIIREAYQSQIRGENLMLMAETNGYPAGQIWIDLKRNASKNSGFLWAFRVCLWLQNLGIGTALLNAAEHALRSRNFGFAELGVEKCNFRARRLYEKHGYSMTGSLQETVRFQSPDGKPQIMEVDEWILRKKL